MSVTKQIHVVIPAGTKVLTRAGGRVGIVVHTPAAPEHGYRVRFATEKRIAIAEPSSPSSSNPMLKSQAHPRPKSSNDL